MSSTSTSDYETTPPSILSLPKKLIVQRKSPTLSYSSDETIPDPNILKSLLSKSTDNISPPFKLIYEPSLSSQELQPKKDIILSSEDERLSPVVIRKKPINIQDQPIYIPSESTPEKTIPEESVAIPEESVAIPEESVAIPEESVAIPEESVVIPEESVVIPEESVTTTEESVAIPEESVTTTEESVADQPITEESVQDEDNSVYNIYDKMTNDQLDMVSLSRNILKSFVNKREKKLELLINDPRRTITEQKILNTVDIGLLNIGELLFLAATRNIYMDKITKSYFRQRILVILIYLSDIYPDWEFRSYTCDNPEKSNLKCDELINILSYEEALFILTFFNINDEHIDSLISILDEKEIYNVIKTASFPKLSSNIISKIKRYAILKTIPQKYLIPLSFNIIPSDLTMGENYDHIIRLLIKTHINQAEDLFSIKRDWNTVNIKNEFGILPPNDYISSDYMAVNIQEYPKKKPLRDFNIYKPENIKDYNDIEIYEKTKILPAYTSRLEFIENIKTYLEATDNIYFISSGSNLIYYGNIKQSNKYSLDSLRRILSLIKKDTITDKPELQKDLRDLQKILISNNLMNNSLNKSLVNAIMINEGRINGASQLFSFNELGTYNIGLVRRGLIQMFYYSRTNNPIYKPFIGENIIMGFTSESSYKDMVNKNKLNDILYFSLFYLDLFFCFNSYV